MDFQFFRIDITRGELMLRIDLDRCRMFQACVGHPLKTNEFETCQFGMNEIDWIGFRVLDQFSGRNKLSCFDIFLSLTFSD